MVAELPRASRRPTLLKALAVGNAAALGFVVAGGPLLRAAGSTIDDLRIAGGTILLVFATYDLLFSREQRKEPLTELGGAHAGEQEHPTDDHSATGELVPLGIPLLVGPASLAAIFIVSESYGLWIMGGALLANAAINALLLASGQRFVAHAGPGTTRALGKVMGLFLASLAVAMIRTGIANTVAGG
jgi:multiple antibiotic resistance protein